MRYSQLPQLSVYIHSISYINNCQIISSCITSTFHTYFLKEKHRAGDIHCELDVRLFGEKIAPALGITRRYVGSEPLCPVTAGYNAHMKALLPEYGVQLIEIERKTDADGPISASRVRMLLAEGNIDALAALLPVAVLHEIT